MRQGIAHELDGDALQFLHYGFGQPVQLVELAGDFDLLAVVGGDPLRKRSDALGERMRPGRFGSFRLARLNLAQRLAEAGDDLSERGVTLVETLQQHGDAHHLIAIGRIFAFAHGHHFFFAFVRIGFQHLDAEHGRLALDAMHDAHDVVQGMQAVPEIVVRRAEFFVDLSQGLSDVVDELPQRIEVVACQPQQGFDFGLRLTLGLLDLLYKHDLIGHILHRDQQVRNGPFGEDPVEEEGQVPGLGIAERVGGDDRDVCQGVEAGHEGFLHPVS